MDDRGSIGGDRQKSGQVGLRHIKCMGLWLGGKVARVKFGVLVRVRCLGFDGLGFSLRVRVFSLGFG